MDFRNRLYGYDKLFIFISYLKISAEFWVP